MALQPTQLVPPGFLFDLEYDGPALANHEMDVRDLAPALLNAADLFRTLNRLTNPTQPELQVNIRATGEGSFLLALKMLYEQGQGLLTNPIFLADEAFAGLLALGIGVIRYVRKRGRDGPPTTVQNISVTVVNLIWIDGSHLEVPPDAMRVADEPAVRRALAEMVRPVGRAGIDVMRIRRDANEEWEEEVSKDDLPALQTLAEPGREILSVSERDVYLTIRTVVFDENLKWRFTEPGLANFAAPIVDSEFRAKLRRREEVFADGDVLHCTLRTTQWRDASGIRSEAEVVRVIEHLPPSQPPPELFSP